MIENINYTMIENINSKLRFRVWCGIIEIIGFLRKQKKRIR